MKHCLLMLLTLTLIGCSSYQTPRPAPRAEQVALISHIVFVKLVDPSDYSRILADADQQLNTIASVARFGAGAPLDTGRETVLDDYDLAIYLGFNSQDDLAAYVAHPQHNAFLEKWMSRIETLKVYDMLDEPMVSEVGLRCRVKRNGLFGFFY